MMSRSCPDTDRCRRSATSVAATRMSPTPRSQADALCRRVQETDYAALLGLQEANLRDNLAPDQRTEGFLSARFSRDQFATMDADVAVVVAEIDGSIVGYLCGSSVEFNRRFA